MTSYATLFNIGFSGLVFFTSLLLSLLLVPLSDRLARFWGILDRPDERKMHTVPVARTGGLAIALSFFLTVALHLKFVPLVRAFVAGAGVLAFTGLIDDKFHISARFKFLGQLLGLLVFVSGSGVVMTGFGNLLGFGPIQFGPLAVPVTLFCMLGIINAVNLSDGLDGLAAGIAAITLIFYAMLAYQNQAWFWLSLAIAFLGSTMGFLRYNSYPARLFMGDTGSLLLGYALAAVGMGLVSGQGAIPPAVPPITIAILLTVPLVDTLWVMVSRLRAGSHPFRPDKRHLHHRLLAMGVPHAAVVPILYGTVFAFGCIGWLGRNLADWQQFYGALLLVVILYGILFLLERSGAQWRNLPVRIPLSRARLRREIVKVSGKSTRVVSLLFPMLLFLPLFFYVQVPKMYGVMALAAAGFVLLLYPWVGGRRLAPLGHGVFFAACFALLLLYHFTPGGPEWVVGYLSILSVCSFCWVVFRIVFKRHNRVLLPSSFELLLIFFSWFLPVIGGELLHLSAENCSKLVLVCIQAIPMLGVNKIALRRQARRNRWMALAYVSMFLFLGGRGFGLL